MLLNALNAQVIDMHKDTDSYAGLESSNQTFLTSQRAIPSAGLQLRIQKCLRSRRLWKV